MEHELFRRAFYFTQTLENCAISGKLRGVQYFTANGVRDSRALHRAVWGGHLQIVQHLVEHGDGNVQDENLLLWAAWKGNLDAIVYLCMRGAPVNEECLQYAALSGHIETLEFLLSKYSYNNADVLRRVAQSARRYI